MSLALQTIRTALIGLVVLGAMLFIPAGTFAYGPGWAFIIVFSAMTTGIGLYLAIKDPTLLERRMKVGPAAEQRPLQKALIGLSFGALIVALVVSALDWRFGWSGVPLPVIVLGNVLVAVGLLLTLVVMMQNRFAASTIRTMEDQQVISTGLYGIVRHPMYSGALIMSIGVPLALGSYWGLLVILVVVPVLVLRILDEEQMLVEELEGYAAYRQKVRSRLIPGIW
jgi:protein-S-isoprenylcysteine O-methyltransferase Ste14